MNYNYFINTLTKLDMPKESINPLIDSFMLLKTKEEEIDKLIKLYDIDMMISFNTLLGYVDDIASSINQSKYCAEFVFLILLTEIMKNKYLEFGLDLDVFYTTLQDFKWKLYECKLIYNEYGTFVGTWFEGIFRLKRFELGRLQFEIAPFGMVYERNGIIIDKDDMVLNIHIPRTMTPLDMKSVEESMDMAQEFFKKYTRKDVTPFVCYTWLFHPATTKIFKQDGNIMKFYNMFEIIESGDYDEHHDLWRVFDMNVDLDNLDILPQNTEVQRKLLNMLKNNEKTGYGLGIYLRDVK